jgi:hypothetical protein
MLNKNDSKVFEQKLRAALGLIYEAFAMVGELDASDDNTISDAINNIEQVAQDVTGTYGLTDDDE